MIILLTIKLLYRKWWLRIEPDKNPVPPYGMVI